MRSGVFNTVTVVGATERGVSHIPHGIFQGINDKSNENGLKVLLGEGFYNEKKDFEPEALKELITDGLLIHYYIGITDRIKSRVESYHLPFIWLNAAYDKNAVRPDDFEAGKSAAEKLAELGHEKIAYVSYHGDRHYSIKERYEGALSVFKNFKRVNFTEQFTDSYSEGVCEKDAYELLSSENVPTAVICYETAEAIAICSAAAALGLSVPEDLSVVVFHAEAARAYIGKRLSTYVVPFQKVGEEALDMLVKRIATGKSYDSVKVPFEYVDDGSLKKLKIND
jgi:DNA-binding LacI/PurR family transcriptional regulator